MRLEFRPPISPKPEFYSQIRLLAQSLARLGPPYSTATIQVSVGERPHPDAVAAANHWATAFPVEWYVVPDAVYESAPHPAWVSGLGRYARASDADVVILCDADTCPVARFDELLAQLDRRPPTIAGLQAHYSPFRKLDSETTWRRLLRDIGEPDATPKLRYSMDVGQVQGPCPPYFNYGFVAFNASAFRAIAPVMAHYLHTACDALPGNPFAAQVALTLALTAVRADVIQLGHEFNCANDDVLTSHGLVAIDDVRVIHYLRGDEFNRHEFLCNRDRFDDFIGSRKRNLITERLRRHVMAIPDAFIEWPRQG